MSDQILIDTNVVLDLAMEGRPEHDAATELALAIASGAAEASVCATSLKDVYYILTKHMGEPDARAYVRALIDAFSLCAVDLPICRQAIESNEADFEDGIVRACAETAGVDFIISRDEKAFARSRIKRLDANDYLALSNGTS